ncbi:MAG: amidohydrolase [bacterium]|nr:amidohydrolase [bacterium]
MLGAAWLVLLGAQPSWADELEAALIRDAAATEASVQAWRRDFHSHPELSNRETRTAGVVASVLEELGLEVRRGIAHTGVVGVLRGGAGPGPTVALRADMDALPVTEETGLPFASTVRTSYRGSEVGVMHACGHDAHTAILLGAAQVLTAHREQLPGTVLFVFQPAEEGAPAGEKGGARLMLKEGVFDDPRPDAVLGLHVVPQYEAGQIAVVSGGAMAGSDGLQIRVRGRQTHAAYPWLGVDPIAVASRIVLALQAIPGRRVDARLPSIVSIGAIHGGVRGNIIPAEVELRGTIRHTEPSMQAQLHQKVEQTATKIAESAGALAEVTIGIGYPVTYNDASLTARIRPALERAAGPGGVVRGLLRTGAEDFSFFSREVPGVYYWLGIRKPGLPEQDAAPNHSPQFTIDESALPLGVRAMVLTASDLLIHGMKPGQTMLIHGMKPDLAMLIHGTEPAQAR